MQRERLLDGPLRLLHIAPEPFFAARFRADPSIEYISGDLHGHGTMRLDVTDLPFETGRFDAIICSHVLEHVPDDNAALRELRRVLSGWGILQVPIRAETTVEDSSVATPEERLSRFGQEDHVRIVGRDYFQRYEAAGFAVEFVDYAATLAPEEIARYCCDDGDPIIFVR